MGAKTVLIIDDDESITKTFVRILQKNGYNADSAVTGEEGLQKASVKFYDVALIDVCLPDFNGTELLDKLPNSERMVKIIITGFPSESMKGADAYLLKPVKPQELLALLKEKIKEKTKT